MMDSLFQNLSVMSCQGDEVGSENASFVAHSVNYVHIQEDASEEEKAIHKFLDLCGIYEINVSM